MDECKHAPPASPISIRDERKRHRHGPGEAVAFRTQYLQTSPFFEQDVEAIEFPSMMATDVDEVVLRSGRMFIASDAETGVVLDQFYPRVVTMNRRT